MLLHTSRQLSILSPLLCSSVSLVSLCVRLSVSLVLTVSLSLYHNCDSTVIRLRHDYDEKLTCSFFARVESRRIEAGARDTS